MAAGVAVAADEPGADQPPDPGRHAEIPHSHDPETLQKLREAVPVYKGFTDEQLHEGMRFMRADYAWYISGKDVGGKVGVLMLNHGVSEESDRKFKAAVDPVGEKFPTAIGFGMAMTSSEALQQAVDELNARGVQKIIAVDPDSSEHKSLYRQWRYILGQSGKAAYVAVPQIRSRARIILAPPINDSPLIGRVLLDHANELSRDQRREAVVVIAHGPEDDADNGPDLEHVKALAGWLKRHSRFPLVEALNIQDDAPTGVRAANVVTFRKMVTDAQAKGLEVIVVPYAINTKGIQPKLQKDLEGLRFRFADKGISAHPNFVKWVMTSVEKAAGRKIS
jgi:hypothetical protein